MSCWHCVLGLFDFSRILQKGLYLESIDTSVSFLKKKEICFFAVYLFLLPLTKHGSEACEFPGLDWDA